jgi:hypothetical protein
MRNDYDVDVPNSLSCLSLRMTCAWQNQPTSGGYSCHKAPMCTLSQTPKSASPLVILRERINARRSGYYLYKVMSGQTGLLQATQSLEHLSKAG